MKSKGLRAAVGEGKERDLDSGEITLEARKEIVFQVLPDLAFNSLSS